MSRFVPDSWREPGGHFGKVLLRVVDFRGIEFERELIEFLGRKRLGEMYQGDDPRLGELIEITRILDVPISTFLIHDEGEFPELEIAFSEALREAANMSPEERARLADEILSAPARALGKDQDSGPSEVALPESLLRIIRNTPK